MSCHYMVIRVKCKLEFKLTFDGHFEKRFLVLCEVVRVHEGLEDALGEAGLVLHLGHGAEQGEVGDHDQVALAA